MYPFTNRRRRAKGSGAEGTAVTAAPKQVLVPLAPDPNPQEPVKEPADKPQTEPDASVREPEPEPPKSPEIGFNLPCVSRNRSPRQVTLWPA